MNIWQIPAVRESCAVTTLEACGENDRAAYGKHILQYVADKMTAEFGKGFNIRNLQMMRKFYLTFPNTNTLCSQLSWSHYRLFNARV